MEQQLMILQGASPAVQEATAMHYEIVEAAKTAVGSLLELGRKLKRMRDSGRYKELGFDTFGAYTEEAVGIRQRQAYNYIQVVETLPAQLIEENAAAGVTKLALLTKLAPGDREEVTAGGLANITVVELQKLIEERNGLAEQLTILQDTERLKDGAGVVADVVSREIDIEEIRRQAAEKARRETWEEAKLQAAEIQERMMAEARREAVLQAVKNMRAEARQLVEAERKKAADEKQKLEEELKSVKVKIEDARREAAEHAAKEQERKDRARLEAAEMARKEAEEETEKTRKQLALSNDTEAVEFRTLFAQLGEKIEKMQALAETMREKGKTEDAAKYMKALAAGLNAYKEQVEGGVVR